MTWTPGIVRSRFLEAADTERRMPLGGGAPSSGYWPSYVHTFEDMNGWGTRRLAEEREMRLRRAPASAAAVSRYFETLQWSATHIVDNRRREIVWSWAFCQIYGRSFAEHCRKHGFVKMTAYRRLAAVFADISEKLRNNNVLLREPEHLFTLPESDFSVLEGASSDIYDIADEPSSPQAFISEPSVDLLTTPEAIEAFESFLRKVNKKRRKERQRHQAEAL